MVMLIDSAGRLGPPCGGCSKDRPRRNGDQYMSRGKRLVARSVAAAAALGVAVGATAVMQAQNPQPKVSREDILAFHAKDDGGGSAPAGRALFEERCAVCHRFGAIGKD